MEVIKSFLLDYLKLCLQYNIKISSCGCCNSPFLLFNKSVEFITPNNSYIEDVEVDFENKCIEFDVDGTSYKMYVNGEIKEIIRWTWAK